MLWTIALIHILVKDNPHYGSFLLVDVQFVQFMLALVDTPTPYKVIAIRRIEKRVTTLFTWLVQCLIGGFCFGWTLTISFSVFFLLIRKYTNGYHAATYSKCLFCSILLEVVLLASISYVFRTGLALLFLTIVSDITILYIAPVNNKSIHWSTNEFKAAKIAVRWLLLILNIFAILLVGTQIAPSILQGLVAALTADAITLSISRCQN